jgi:FkbM family methyltransferase
MALRGVVLEVAGGSWPARVWANGKGRPHGIRVERSGDAITLRRGDRAILLSPKHLFYAGEVTVDFDGYADALASTEREGVRVTDYTGNPNIFNLCRRCLRAGARIQHRGGVVWLRKGERAVVLAPRHFAYVEEITEKFDLYYTPLVPELRDGLEVLDYSQPGRLQTYRRSGLQFEMASFPEEEEAIEEYFRWYRPQAGDLVFDVGAHCGVSTYHLSKLVGPEGRVIAFEPDPVNFAILKRNIDRHGLANVVTENAAMASTAGGLAFNAEGTIGSSLVSLLQRESVGETVTVNALTLGDAFARWGVPAFCKIDIEGAEVDVFRSSGEVLSRCKTHFAVDTNHPKADGSMTHGDVEKSLGSYGYETASAANPLWTTWARPR